MNFGVTSQQTSSQSPSAQLRPRPVTMVTTRGQKRAEQKARDAIGARKLFDLPEMLEKILLDVDMKTLLLAQRVDKTFKATIDGSVKLQKTLWLLPDTCHIEDPESDEDMTVNPLLDDFPSEKRRKPPLGIYNEYRDSKQAFKAFIWSDLPQLPLQLGSGPESWRKMQLARPQRDIKKFVCHVDVFEESDDYSMIVSREITLGCDITASQVPPIMLKFLQEQFPRCFNSDGKLTATGRKKFPL